MKTKIKSTATTLFFAGMLCVATPGTAQNDSMQQSMKPKQEKMNPNQDTQKTKSENTKKWNDSRLSQTAMANEHLKLTGGREKMSDDNMKKTYMEDLQSWPATSQMAVKEQTDKYGAPNEATPTTRTWYNNGVFAKTIVTKMESTHDFPKPHTDMMEQSIMHKVPVNMYDDLARFDGSVTVDRTQGLLAARCDKEENNLLALNLAHDIIMGTKTVEVARKAFTDIIAQSMKGKKHPYMQKLMFTPKKNTPDADVVTIKMP